nr:cyclic nucleotide-binding domain-containing protein [Candidatus Venteria ishoeyi]
MDILLWVLVGMLLSRAVVVYGLLPIVRWMKQTTAISRGYQLVLYWGGLRGAVALALVMSLPQPLYNETLVAVVTGAVLFTLLVQGLSIEPLVKKLGLNEPPLEDRLSKLEGTLEAVRNAAKRIPELKSGGLFSARIAGQLEQEYQQNIDKTYQQLQDLRKDHLSSETERRLLYIHCFATEKVIYYRLFSKGHLSEEVYRDLAHSLTLQTDSMRHQGQVPAYTLHSQTRQMLERKLLIWLSHLPGFARLAEAKRMRYTTRTYEKNWGLYQGGRKVLRELREFKRLDPERSAIDEVAQSYQRWHDNAQQRLDAAAEQLPEFVTAMQTRLARRTLLQGQKEDLQAQAEAGFVPEHVASELIEQLQNPLRNLRGYESHALRLDPVELLHQVPLFQTLSHEELGHLAKQLRNLTLPPGEIIIHKGESGNSMFLIGRGVVRIVRESSEPELQGQEQQLATLLAGDFFGEMALLHKTPRNATCRSITPCVIYELQRDAFEKLIEQYPILQEKVEQVAQARK